MTDIDCRRTSFGSVAAEYERARPGYPDEAVDWLAAQLRIAPGRTILDLGAGTGKLTRQLVGLGADVVAVEPLDEMRSELERAVPAAASLAGTAEVIPLPAGSVDAVTSAQAFHWFDPIAALPEIHRVLRPAGGLGLIWNTRDMADPLQAAISAIVEEDLSPFDEGDETVATVEASELFGRTTRMRCRFGQEVSRAQLVERVASMSIVAAREPRDRAGVLGRIADAVASLPEPIPMAYVTEAFAFQRVG